MAAKKALRVDFCARFLDLSASPLDFFQASTLTAIFRGGKIGCKGYGLHPYLETEKIGTDSLGNCIGVGGVGEGDNGPFPPPNPIEMLVEVSSSSNSTGD